MYVYAVIRVCDPISEFFFPNGFAIQYKLTNILAHHWPILVEL